MVATGVKGCSGGRAHGRGMKTGVAQPSVGKSVDVRRIDLGPVTAEVSKADIVEHHDQYVWSAARCRRRGCPMRL